MTSIALVTGATGGIGRALTRQLQAKDCRVAAIGEMKGWPDFVFAFAATWYALDWGVWFIGLAAGIALLAALARPFAAY